MKALTQSAFTLFRGTDGHYDEGGNWNDPTKTETPFRGSIQPVGSNTSYVQKILPEGVRLEAARVVYTRTELMSGDDRTGLVADDITFDNPLTTKTETYEVFKVDPWIALHSLHHYKAFVYLKDRGR